MAALDNFRRNLRSECDKLEMTHRELARKSKLHHVSVSRILNGHVIPTIPVAERLAKAVGVPLEKIFS